MSTLLGVLAEASVPRSSRRQTVAYGNMLSCSVQLSCFNAGRHTGGSGGSAEAAGSAASSSVIVDIVNTSVPGGGTADTGASALPLGEQTALAHTGCLARLHARPQSCAALSETVCYMVPGTCTLACLFWLADL